jgi:hypothetical protein
MDVVRIRPTKLNRRYLLQLLGLPFASRWEIVAPHIRERIVRARRSGLDEEAAQWSQAKAYLRRILPRQCGTCKETINPRCKRCIMCYRQSQERKCDL